MLNRFNTTSTNLMVELAARNQHDEFKHLLDIHTHLQILITGFNLGVERMFIENTADGMAEFCTEAGVQRFHEKYANWKNEQVAALTLVSCDFLSFNLSEDQNHAQVFTYEKWIFTYNDGRKVHTEGSVDGYDVHKNSNGWRVDSVKFYAPEANPR